MIVSKISSVRPPSSSSPKAVDELASTAVAGVPGAVRRRFEDEDPGGVIERRRGSVTGEALGG